MLRIFDGKCFARKETCEICSKNKRKTKILILKNYCVRVCPDCMEHFKKMVESALEEMKDDE